MDEKTAGGLSDVQLHFETFRGPERVEEGPLLERLPQLYLPEGAKLRGNGGVKHFGAQVLAAGWGEVETLGGEGAGLCHYALAVGGQTYDARLFLGSVPDSYLHTLHFGAAERGGEEGHGLLVLSNPEGDGWTSRWAGGTDTAAAPELPQRASRTSQGLQLLAGQVFEHTLYSAALGEFRADHVSPASVECPALELTRRLSCCGRAPNAVLERASA